MHPVERVRGMVPGFRREWVSARLPMQSPICIRPIEHTICVLRPVQGLMALEDLLCTQSFAPEASSIELHPATS
jgi:hypothetical protein